MSSETFFAPSATPDEGVNLSRQIAAIAQKFEGDPSRILAAFAESQRRADQEDIIVVLPIVVIKNATFPPAEFQTRWRLAYGRARVSRHYARITSQAYFSASAERFTDLTNQSRILTWSGPALREELGKRCFARISGSLIRFDDAPKSSMALRTFVSDAFEAGDYQLRPPRDWAQFLLDCIVEFYPGAALEMRQECFPWEALPAPAKSFLLDVQERAADAHHDPSEALRRALST